MASDWHIQCVALGIAVTAGLACSACTQMSVVHPQSQIASAVPPSAVVGRTNGDRAPLSEPVQQQVETAAAEEAPEGPLTLEELIRLALDHNPDLESARYRVARAEAMLARARAEFFPTLTLSENYSVSDNPVMAFMFKLNQAQFSLADLARINDPDTTDDFHTQLQITQPLYTGGRLTSSLAAAEHGTQAAEYELAALRNTLVAQLAEAYYRLIQARNLVRVREESLEQVREHLRIVEARFRAGSAVQSDVLTIRVRLAEAEEALIVARQQYELAWDVLDNVVGAPVPRKELPEEPAAAPWSDGVGEIEQLVREAFDRRPELAMIREQLAAAEHRVEVARAGRRPTAGLVADYDVHTGDWKRGDDSFFVGVMLAWKLLDSGRTAAEVQKALAQYGELSAAQRKLVLDVELDIRRAYLAWVAARERLRVARQAVEQARATLREVEARYRAESATITELVDAQVALSEARVREQNAAAELHVARAALERAVGRLAEIQP